MEVIHAMDEEEFRTVCDAGVELKGLLDELVRRFGLSPEHAPSVLAVAAAGVNVSTGHSADRLVSAIDNVSRLWNRSTGGLVSFGPIPGDRGDAGAGN